MKLHELILEDNYTAHDAWDALLRALFIEEEEADLNDMYDGDDEELKRKLAKLNHPLKNDPMYKKAIKDPEPLGYIQELIDGGITINKQNARHWAEDIMGGFGTSHSKYKPPKGMELKAGKKLTNYIYKMFDMDDDVMLKIDE